jgi:uncharacterized repeat protein (TIGR03806 family)
MVEARRWPAAVCGLLFAGLVAGCGTRPAPAPVPVTESAAGTVQGTPTVQGWSDEEPPDHLSAFGLFRGDGSAQEPADGVIPYDVNTPLFSDYALKYRFVRVPPGTKAQYREPEALDFPEGTVLVKTFAYANDARDLARGRRLIETRLLVNRPTGWVGLPYVWNDEQTEATLRIAGVTKDVHRIGPDGAELTHRYAVPNANQCLGCHENSKVMKPIGPTARGLNRQFNYPDGPENQLTRWTRLGILEGAPSPEKAPRMAVWNDPSTGSVEHRARAWLEANCAHCHNPAGPARTSGFDLRVVQNDPFKSGVWKMPIAAGKGSGGRFYDIVPGSADKSIVTFRIESTEPGIMMPELGRRLVDKEGVALVRSWIDGMHDPRAQ